MTLIPPHIERVSLENLEDNIFGAHADVLAELKADPLWDHEPFRDIFVRRTPAFIVLRDESRRWVDENLPSAKAAFDRGVASLGPHLPEQVDGPALPSFTRDDDTTGLQCLYVVISAGTAADRAMEGAVLSTPAAAFALWRDRLMAYVAANPGPILYWRKRPELGGWVGFESGRQEWGVYSRLVIPPAIAVRVSDMPDATRKER